MAGRSAKKKNSTAPLKKAVTLIAVFVVLLFTVLDLTGLVSFDSLLIKAGVEDKPAEHAQTEVHFIDVGQGDSTLVISQGEAMLIDSGDKDDSNKIEKYLEKQGVTELKYLIATHPHADHIGEMSEIIDQFQVDKFIMPKVKADMTPTTTIYEKMLKSIKAKDLKITQAKPMEFELGSCKVELFTPKKDYDDLNNYSTLVKITDGENSFLITGIARPLRRKIYFLRVMMFPQRCLKQVITAVPLLRGSIFLTRSCRDMLLYPAARATSMVTHTKKLSQG